MQMHPELTNHYKKSNNAQRNHVFPLSSWESSQKTEEETIQFKLNHKASDEEPMFKLNNQNKKKKQKSLETIKDFENLTKIEKRLSYYSTHPEDKRKRRAKKRLTLTPSDGMDIGNFVTQELCGRRKRFVENARKTHYYFEMMKVAEIGCSIYSMIGLLSSIFAYDIDFVTFTDGHMVTLPLPQNYWPLVRKISLYVVFITSLMQMACVVIRYRLKVKWMKARKIVTEKYGLMNSREKVYISLEFILILLMPYPFFTDFHMESFNEFENIKTVYSVNDLLTMAIFMRVFYVLRTMVMHTPYYNNSAHRLFLFTKSDCSYTFALRCMMKNYPLVLMFAIFTALVFFFAYLLKISERPLIYAILMRERLTNPNYVVLYDLSDYMNCVWLLIITMTTVGYGDYTPKTISGRSIIVAACMLGIMTVSMIVIIFNTLFKLSTSEARALAVVQNMIYNKNKKKPAAEVIGSLARLGFFGGKVLSRQDKQNGERHIRKIKKNLQILHSINEKYKDSNHTSFFNEELSRRILFIKEDLEEIETEINVVIEKSLKMLDDDSDLDL